MGIPNRCVTILNYTHAVLVMPLWKTVKTYLQYPLNVCSSASEATLKAEYNKITFF